MCNACDVGYSYSEMPPKRAASAKDKGTNANTDNAGDNINRLRCGHTTHTLPKLDIIDEGTKEFYLIQIRDLENRVAR